MVPGPGKAATVTLDSCPGPTGHGCPGASGPAIRLTSTAWLTSRRPWRELLSGVTLPGGPTAPADLLAREPQALLLRA